MKIDCEVIMDLLPLYVENIASQKSREMVEEHTAECKKCKQIMESMKESEPEIVHNAEPIKNFKKRFRRHTIVTIICTSIIVLIALLILISGLNMEPGDEMGFAILFLYLVLPTASFICSAIAGTQRSKIKWLIPIICGAFGLLIPYAIFHNYDDIALTFGLYPSILGLIVGLISGFVFRMIGKLIRKIKNR